MALATLPRSTHTWLKPIYDWLDTARTAINTAIGSGAATVMQTDSAQTVTGAKTFATTMLRVFNAGATFAHRFVSSATATRTFTLPDFDSTAATLAGSETLANKTLTAPAIADFTSATHDHSDASEGGTLPAQSITGTAVVESRTINTTAPLTGGGDLSATRTFALAASVLGASQSITGPGAVDVVARTTKITTTGADAFTFGNGGYTGQRKSIVLVVDGGNSTITPSALAIYTAITLAAPLDGVELEWNGAAWDVLALHGTATAA